MEIHQLRYFVAVAEEGSFSRAAAREHVAQPGERPGDPGGVVFSFARRNTAFTDSGLFRENGGRRTALPPALDAIVSSTVLYS